MCLSFPICLPTSKLTIFLILYKKYVIQGTKERKITSYTDGLNDCVNEGMNKLANERINGRMDE